MTKSKRRRKVMLARKASLEELGIRTPEINEDIESSKRQYILATFKRDLGLVGDPYIQLSNITGNPINSSDKGEQIINYHSQIFLTRSFVIQYFVILDTHINSILAYHQDKIGVSPKMIQHYKEVDIGIKNFIPQENRTSNFESTYSRIKHFRMLRNQFAHYQHGHFILEAKRESFESFLKTLDGIELDSDGGYHGQFNGKAGMFIPYTSDSPNYLQDLLKTGEEFLKQLLEIFYPDLEEGKEPSQTPPNP